MIECEPTDSEVVSVACPVLFVVPVPSGEVPLRNVTVSPAVGVGDTVAVKVTDWPTVDGFCEDCKVVVVVIWVTVCDTVLDVASANDVSPE